MNWAKLPVFIDDALTTLTTLWSSQKIHTEIEAAKSSAATDATAKADTVQAGLDAHVGNKQNPHAVTVAQIGAETPVGAQDKADAAKAAAISAAATDASTKASAAQANAISAAAADATTKANAVQTSLKDSTVSNVRVLKDVARIYAGSNSVKGALKITIPATWNNTLFRLKVTGSSAFNSSAWEVTINGYNQISISSWTDTSAILSPNCPFTSVRLGHDGTNCCILLGVPTTTWSYPAIKLDEVQLTNVGANNVPSDGWSLAFIATETGITINSTPTPKVITDNTRTDVFAPATPYGEFFVEGDANTFYPIVFEIRSKVRNSNPSTYSPPPRLIIHRWYHQDANGTGSLMFTLEGTSDDWGGGSANHFARYYYKSQHFVANWSTGSASPYFTVWLRGRKTYRWEVEQAGGSTVIVDYAAVDSKTTGNDTWTSTTTPLYEQGYYINNKLVVDSTRTDIFAPAGYGLGTSATLATTDWNNYVTTGFFRGGGLLNAPTSGASHWYFVIVMRQDNLHAWQRASGFGDSPRKSWERRCYNGVWTPWLEIVTTDNPVFTGAGTVNVGDLSGGFSLSQSRTTRNTTYNVINTNAPHGFSLGQEYNGGAYPYGFTISNIASPYERYFAITQDGNIVINPTSTLTVGAGGLIVANGHKFPATQVPSADPNTQDDYEEGTFTPVAFGSTTSGTGTYTAQTGKYTKIGNAVTFGMYISWTEHTGTGSLMLGGLPFVVSGSLSSSGSIIARGLTYSGQLGAQIQTNNTNILLQQLSSDTTNLVGVPMDTFVTGIWVCGTYFTN